MTLTYQLKQNDFLEHQLFVASTTPRIRSKRRRSWLWVTVSMFVLAFLFSQSGNSFLTYYFLGFGIVALFFYPLYQRHQYKRHYSTFIAENYKNRFGQTVTIHFTEQAIETSDITGESKIYLSELENVIETGAYFYPGLKAGGHLIIPKSEINTVSRLRQELKQLCDRLKIDFIENLTWKWR